MTARTCRIWRRMNCGAGSSPPTANRLFYLRQALRDGLSVEEIYELTKIDPWFLYQIKTWWNFSEELATFGLLLRQGRGQEQVADMLRRAKEYGFSDRQLAHLWGGDEENLAEMRREAKALNRSINWWTPAPPSSRPIPPTIIPPMSMKCEARPTSRDKVA